MCLSLLLLDCTQAWHCYRDDSKPDVSPSCGPFPHKRIVTVSFSPSHVGFLKIWFVVSTKFLVDDVVVVATENEAAARLIADVSMAQQLGGLFGSMHNNSPFVDFDGQVPRERTADLPNDALGGDRGSAEHALKTSARLFTPESCCRVASPFSKGVVGIRRRNAT